MRCPYCNHRLIKGKNTCPNCGRAVDQTNTTVLKVEEETNNKKQPLNRDFFKEYKEFWIKYADFYGTSSIRDFWISYLFNTLICLVLAFSVVLIVPYVIAIIIPMFAILSRRLNDVGASRWFLMLCLIPGGGYLALLVICCLPKNYFKK